MWAQPLLAAPCSSAWARSWRCSSAWLLGLRCWLFGSRGRDTADALSDTDLWIVVADADSAAVIAERRECVARVARPVLVHEVLGNAPPHGAYVMALYPGQAGPHQVD